MLLQVGCFAWKRTERMLSLGKKGGQLRALFPSLAPRPLSSLETHECAAPIRPIARPTPLEVRFGA